jgi:hypothetical protein
MLLACRTKVGRQVLQILLDEQLAQKLTLQERHMLELLERVKPLLQAVHIPVMLLQLPQLFGQFG